MAKDGTMRGGSRRGAGRPSNDLATKVAEGKSGKVINLPDLPAEDMPKVDEWLNDEQHNGEQWDAEALTKRTVAWLQQRGCDRLIPMQQILTYSVAAARWIQCQRAISKYGFTAKHPTTGEPCESPYVRMADRFYKEQASAWYAIFQVVKDCAEQYEATSPSEDVMAGLLSS